MLVASAGNIWGLKLEDLAFIMVDLQSSDMEMASHFFHRMAEDGLGFVGYATPAMSWYYSLEDGIVQNDDRALMFLGTTKDLVPYAMVAIDDYDGASYPLFAFDVCATSPDVPGWAFSAVNDDGVEA
jgi:hypothetical protein